MRRQLIVSICAAVSLGVSGSLAVSVSAAPEAPGSSPGTSATYDVRKAADNVLYPNDRQVAAVKALAADAGPGTRVTWNPYLATPRTIDRLGGTLTTARSGQAADVARSWIVAHRDAFGLSAADVSALTVSRDHALPGTGTHVVTFTQSVGGLAVFGSGLTVAVDSTGRVLRYHGTPARSVSIASGHALSAAQALSKVAAALAPGVSYSPSQTGTELGYTVFSAGPFASVQRVVKGAFATGSALRPAYRVLFIERLNEAYNVVVDAQTGAILYRASLVDHEAEGTVYRHFPGAPHGGRAEVVSFGPTATSPSGYVDPSGTAGLDGPTTFGNNADTFANYSNFIAPADRANRPVSPTAQFNYRYADNWGTTNGALVPPSYVLDRDPAAANLFWHHNRIHDEYYRLGFTETGGNFQVNNGDRGGQGADPIAGLVHAGATSGGAPTYTGRDNAYMLTLPDGIQSWSGMFLWEPINDSFEVPYRDGNFDASVIQHEYTHGLSNRYVANGGEGLGPLNAEQSGAMGEGWSDWYALDYLYREGLETKSVVGEYATGNPSRGIRNWSYDDNPLNYGNYGYDLPGAEVHSDGEIWTTILWDLRKALVAQFGQAVGSEISARIITDGMPLTPSDPSFVDARDGIIAADEDRYNGAHVDTIWTVFAKRGLGVSASAVDADDIDPTPGFDHASPSRNGTLVGQVINAATGSPVANARIFIGEYEVRSTPVAKTPASGGFVVPMVAGKYAVTIQAPGYGAQTFKDVAVSAGKSASLKFKVAPNLASTAAGAQLVNASSQKDGLPATFLLDDAEASVWATKPTPNGSGGEVAYNDGPDQSVTVQLAKPAKIRTIQVSAYKNTTDPRFAAMKDFAFQVSNDGVRFTTVQIGTFSAPPPRPTAPDLHLRQFTLSKAVDAKFVRMFVNSVQGETMTFAEAAELQVFANVSGLEPNTVIVEQPYVDNDPGNVIVGSNPALISDVIDLGGEFYSVTGGEFTQACTYPPASQGADGWLFKLPAGFGDGIHSVRVTGESPLDDTVGHDIDLFFFDSDCNYIGSKATESADESATIPGGTAYVLAHLYLGANTTVSLLAQRPA